MDFREYNKVQGKSSRRDIQEQERFRLSKLLSCFLRYLRFLHGLPRGVKNSLSMKKKKEEKKFSQHAPGWLPDVAGGSYSSSCVCIGQSTFTPMIVFCPYNNALSWIS